MTKKELIEKLKDMPDDAVVCVYSVYERMLVTIDIVYSGEDREYMDEDGKIKQGNVIGLVT